MNSLWKGQALLALLVAMLGSLHVAQPTLAGTSTTGDGENFVATNADAFFATGEEPRSPAVGDFNGDRSADLAVANTGDDTVSVLLAKGEGSFASKQDFPVGESPVSVAVGDFDADGRSDIAAANFGGSTVSLLRGRGDGTFEVKLDLGVGNSPFSIASAYFNGDSRADIAVVNRGDNTVSVLLGRGDGTFEPKRDFAAGFNALRVAVGDFNGDGAADLAIADNTRLNEANSTLSLLLGDGDGGFQPRREFLIALRPAALAVGDFNRDGRDDLVVANGDFAGGGAGVSLLLGDGDGNLRRSARFGYPYQDSPLSLAVGDFNRDGATDLVAGDRIGGMAVVIGDGVGGFAARHDFTLGGNPLSLAVADFDQDGALDMAVADDRDDNVSLLFGNGDGSFQLSDYGVGVRPISVVSDDFDRDGKADVAVLNASDANVSVLLGRGDGTVATKHDFAVSERSTAMAVADFNSDGNPDLAVASANDAVSVLDGKGDGSFAPGRDFAAGDFPISVTVGDFNGDRNPDIAAANEADDTVSVLLGDGDGSFQAKRDFPVNDGPRAISVGDFNLDGKRDLVVAHHRPDYPSGNTVSVLLGGGDGSFQPRRDFAIGVTLESIAVADFNGDHRPDIVTANTYVGGVAEKVFVALGNGDGSFQPRLDVSVGKGPSSVEAGDFNHDGTADIVTSNSIDNTVSVLLADGHGGFEPKRDFATGHNPNSVAVGDFNGDGANDLTTSNLEDRRASILLNRATTLSVDPQSGPQTGYGVNLTGAGWPTPPKRGGSGSGVVYQCLRSAVDRRTETIDNRFCSSGQAVGIDQGGQLGPVQFTVGSPFSTPGGQLACAPGWAAGAPGKERTGAAGSRCTVVVRGLAGSVPTQLDVRIAVAGKSAR